MLSQSEIDVIRAYRLLAGIEKLAVDELVMLNNESLLIYLVGKCSEGIKRVVESARTQSINQLPLDRT